MRSIVAAVLTLALARAARGARRRAVGPPPRQDGPCVVRGLANLYVSADGGATWSSNAEPQARSGVWDIVALDTDPETVVAVVNRNIYDSTDGGCTWTLRHTIGEEIHHTVHIAPGPNGRAYVWAEEFISRYDRGEVTPLQKPAPVGALAVNPGNREHVRALERLN